MSGPNGQLTPGPGAKIIPLMPGVARPSGGRREELRTAVLQVITHLVIEKVPADQRSPLFDQAAELLDEAGWGLDELYAAAAGRPRTQCPVPGAGTGDLGTAALHAAAAQRDSGPDLEARWRIKDDLASQGDSRGPPRERDQGRRADRLHTPRDAPALYPAWTPGCNPELKPAEIDTNLRGAALIPVTQAVR